MEVRHTTLVLAVVFMGSFTGCSVEPNPLAPTAALSGISGRVHGGQQPVSGATIQLYAVGLTGDGSAALSLLSNQAVLSDANGAAFTITGLYSCSGSTQVYLTATGGNPGLGAVNPNIALMVALGPCSSLTSSTFISVNELTTVAAVEALAPYMTAANAIGSLRPRTPRPSPQHSASPQATSIPRPDLRPDSTSHPATAFRPPPSTPSPTSSPVASTPPEALSATVRPAATSSPQPRLPAAAWRRAIPSPPCSTSSKTPPSTPSASSISSCRTRHFSHRFPLCPWTSESS